MSDRLTSPPPAGPSPRRSMTKLEKRAASKARARAAAAEAAAARRRRQALTGALAGLAVVVVIVVAFVVFRGAGDPDPAQPQAGTTASATASAGGDASAATSGFPPLPDGADPALRTKPTVTAGSGELTKLTVTPLIEGKGAAAQAGQQITVNYVGVSYQTGAEFDSSWSRSQPFSFPLGGGRVIQGWDQGMVGVKVGSRVRLDIPAALAYPNGGGPSGPLRFVVDVLALQ